MRQAEADAARQLRLKEAEWMAEYDRSVQALLKIVQHHEDEKAQLRAEVEKLRELAAAIPSSITKMTRSTQTEIPKQVLVTPKKSCVRFATECETVSGKEDVVCVDVKTKNNIARMQTTESQTDKSPVPKQKILVATHQRELEERNHLLSVRLAAQQNVLDKLLLVKLEQASALTQNGASFTPPNLPREPVANEHGKTQTVSDIIPLSSNPAQYPHVHQNSEMLSESPGTVEQQPLSPAAA
ncbi:hypothetical protein PHMEG_00016092 [Phytophthora megakarya]|uniref:Uncharacterized protein n=1 Tax=Phytophthora megakarya TaxID=4795 RepID=A0A225W172_9STRA|nr:hypothetical protein PHMEG_00016092 [Phytophthora megakarya]